jgi:tetratricopeptide (TPR) repeat protein
MSRRIVLLGALAGALAASTPALAQGNAADAMQSKSDAELGRDLREFLGNPGFAPCSLGMGVAVEWARRHPDQPNSASLLPLAAMYCALSRDEKSEALANYLQFERFNVPLSPYMGLQIASTAEDPDEQLRQLRMFVLDHNTPVEGEYGLAVVGWALRSLGEADRDDDVAQLALEAVRAGRLETLGDDFASSFAYRAIEPAMTEAPELVPDLLGRIDDANSYLPLLADRRYASIWPQVEARVGPHMQLVLDEQVARTQADLAASPASAEALQKAAHALHYAKQDEGVVTLVEQWRARPDAPAEIDQDLAWAINLQGFALQALGRLDEADRVMAEIANLDEDRFGWVVNFAINRASLIVGSGRYEAGLVAVDRARSVTDQQGSTYAKLLVARDRACALERLGRQDEALLEAPYLQENLKDSLDVAGTGLLCLGLRDELVQALREELADEDVARENFAMLQRSGFDLFYVASVLPSVSDLVQGDPALRALLEQHVRVIPDEFVPAS